MKLFTALSLVGFGLGVAGITATQACGGSSSSTGNGTDTAQAGKQPPPKPDAPATTDTSQKTFAINQLLLGESDRSGMTSNSAWKTYGYNLDGKITTKDSTDVCTRQAGAAAANQEDGDQGTDNAFGKVIIPFLQPFTATPSKTLSESLINGSFTIMLKITGLTDDAAQTNTGLAGTLLVGAKFSDTGKPTFTPADDWPYRKDPQIPINDAFINKGTFVNGAGGATIQLSLSISGQTLTLGIYKAIVTFDHSDPNTAGNGTIAGVIKTDDLTAGITKVAGNISTDLCSGSTLDSILQTIRQASDILDDGSNKAGTPCNAISVGIGFTAKKIANPTMAVDNPAEAPSKCSDMDGGTDAAQDH
jgi:hypothetical protein